MINIFLTFVLIIFVVLYWQWNKIKNHFRQKKYIGRTLTKSQKKLLLKVMPIYRNMTNDDRSKLEQHILWFLDNISFLGRDGLKVNAGMRLVVAANACLLVLNKTEGSRKIDFQPLLISLEVLTFFTLIGLQIIES